MLNIGDEVVYEKSLTRWEKEPYPKRVGRKGKIVAHASYTIYKVDFGSIGCYLCAERYLFTPQKYIIREFDKYLIED